MKITINNKILSIPPYVSVAWKNIASLHVEFRLATPVLIIGLLNGSIIEIPSLDATTLETIFSAHTKFMEHEAGPQKGLINKGIFSFPPASTDILGMQFPLPLNDGMETLGSGALTHNPELADTPDLPPEFLEKIGGIAKVLTIDETLLPKPEPHCNCTHCQIAKAIQNNMPNGAKVLEEDVTDEDLKFRTWDIAQSGDKLYMVTNPLDDQEHYSVYLGDPLGCTCGEKNCEHIEAVLKS